jgi:hypothetical protein
MSGFAGFALKAIRRDEWGSRRFEVELQAFAIE